MYSYLINILIFCGILLLIALTVAVVQGIIILIDIQRTTREVKKKIEIFTSLFDIATMVLGGVGKMKSRAMEKSTMVAVVAGIKKSLQILFKKI
ncbi:MAG: hypothetical protein WCT39_04870 [Candidatus Margulisiibacteriota bacterium]